MRRINDVLILAPVIALMVVAPGLAKSRNPAPQPAATTDIMPEGRSLQARALYLALINDMRQSGRTHAALAHLDAFDLQYPHSNDAIVLRGDCLVDIKAFAEATTIYRKLLKTEAAAAAYAGLGRIEGLNGRWAGAASEFGQAVTRAPTSPNYLNDYGYALLKAGNFDQALFRTKQATELAPGDTRARNNLIMVLSATGDRAGAAALLAAIADPAERSEVEAAVASNSATVIIAKAPAPAPSPLTQPVTDPFGQ